MVWLAGSHLAPKADVPDREDDGTRRGAFPDRVCRIYHGAVAFNQFNASDCRGDCRVWPHGARWDFGFARNAARFSLDWDSADRLDLDYHVLEELDHRLGAHV